MPLQLDRRTFLRGAGVAMALPLLDAMRPAFGETKEGAIPRRMVCMETNMGILPQYFFPEKEGKDYDETPYLAKLKAHKDQMTIFSGVSLPGVTGAHAAEKCFLTGTPHPERGGFRNWVSLDQYAAEHVGNRTRYPSLVLAMSGEGSATLSFTRSGAPISAERSPKKLFTRLFVQGKADEVAAIRIDIAEDRRIALGSGSEIAIAQHLQRDHQGERLALLPQHLGIGAAAGSVVLFEIERHEAHRAASRCIREHACKLEQHRKGRAVVVGSW